MIQPIIDQVLGRCLEKTRKRPAALGHVVLMREDDTNPRRARLAHLLSERVSHCTHKRLFIEVK